MLFKKKEEPIAQEAGTLYAITNGRTLPMEEVKDEVFSQKILGDGIAAYSDDGVVYAPCDATVGTVAQSGHAVGLTSADGEEILLHIGINTVREQGKHFHVLVRQGQRVRAGDRLVTFDKKALEAKGYDLVIPVIFSDADTLASLNPLPPAKCHRGDIILRYRKK